MSTLWIVIILVIPIALVIFLLNRAHKKQLQKIDKRNSIYLQQVIKQTGLVNNFQKKLSHQLVILDEVNRKLLVIDHVDSTYSHRLYELDDIKALEVLHVKQIMGSEGKNTRSETFTSYIGLQIVCENGTSSKQLLVFYDHLKHNVFLMADMEKEAKQLQQTIKETIKKKVVS